MSNLIKALKKIAAKKTEHRLIKAEYSITKILDGYSVRQIVEIMIELLERNKIKSKDSVDQGGKPMVDRYTHELKVLKDTASKLSSWPLL